MPGCEGAGGVARLVGGPLDGGVIDVAGWAPEEVEAGVAHVVEGWEWRATYGPAPGGDPLVWEYEGPVP